VTDLTNALKALRPFAVYGAEFSNIDDTYAKVLWGPALPEGFVPPTQEEVAAELARLADPVPSSATRGQLIRVLHHIGKLAEVRDAVAQADVLTQELWLSPTFHRDDPLLRAVAATVGLTDRIDDLFRLSATI
jgi:hypothetical protein